MQRIKWAIWYCIGWVWGLWRSGIEGFRLGRLRAAQGRKVTRADTDMLHHKLMHEAEAKFSKVSQ